jgi:hypothetical protein
MRCEATMTRSVFARVLAALALALLITAHVALAPAPAHASAQTPHTGDTLVLTANNYTFVYGGVPSGPIYTATLTLATPASPALNVGFSVQLDNGEIFNQAMGPVTNDPSGKVYTGKVDGRVDLHGNVMPVGTHAATAYGSTAYGYTPASSWQSDPITITVQGATPQLQCNISNYGQPVSPGQPLSMSVVFMGGNPTTPVDWQNATYTFTFVGPTTYTVANLPPASNSGGPSFTLPAPSTPGLYSQIHCTFNGTSSFAPATGDDVGQPLLVSLKHALGAVGLFSSPTTVATGQAMDMEVVFHAAAGGPIPSGYFNIDLIGGGAYYFTKTITIAPGGDTLVHLDPLPNLNGVTNVRIGYGGDAYYDTAGVLFPLTNPPIPGTGGGSGGGAAPTPTTAPSPTATGTATAVATTVPIPTPTVQATGPRGVYSASTPWYQPGGALWWVILAGLLIVLGGAGGGALWWLRRGKPTALLPAPAHGATHARSVRGGSSTNPGRRST